MLAAAAERGVGVFGLLWRSHPKWLQQSEEANAELVRHIADHGGQVLLDARTRRAGSHHQKLVVIRHPARPDRDVAFVGGIDLGYSRRDDHDHAGDPQVMEFPRRTARARRGTTSRRRSAGRPSTTSSTRSASAGTAAACSTSRARCGSSTTARTTRAR